MIYVIGAIVTFYIIGFSYSHEQPDNELGTCFLMSFLFGVFWPIGLFICASSFGEKTGQIRFYLKDLSESQKRITDQKILGEDKITSSIESLSVRMDKLEEVNEIVIDLKEGV